MSLDDTALLVSQLAMGFALAACVGLRAFLPLLVAGLAARGGYVDLGASFQWMETPPALVVFGSAFVFEVLADKIPWLDHALHAAEVFVKPAVATLLGLAGRRAHRLHRDHRRPREPAALDHRRWARDGRHRTRVPRSGHRGDPPPGHRRDRRVDLPPFHAREAGGRASLGKPRR